MVELLRSNDLVLISYARALLAAENVTPVDVDEHASSAYGGISSIRRRLMVADADLLRARQLLVDAGLGLALDR